MGTALERAEIEALLDECLLVDEEMDAFRRHCDEVAKEEAAMALGLQCCDVINGAFIKTAQVSTLC